MRLNTVMRTPIWIPLAALLAVGTVVVAVFMSEDHQKPEPIQTAKGVDRRAVKSPLSSDARASVSPTDAGLVRPAPIKPAPTTDSVADAPHVPVVAALPPSLIQPARANVPSEVVPSRPTPPVAQRPKAKPGKQSPKNEPPGLPNSEPVFPLEIARTALGMVGADGEAEAVWVEAINDTGLTAKARKDLIEDLNEEGFEDLKNLTEGDVALILRRLALIEEVAPYAMDDVNAAAFEEAYVDLVKMLAKASAK